MHTKIVGIALATAMFSTPAAAETVSLALDKLPTAQGWIYLEGGPNTRGENAYFSAASGFSLDQDTRGDAVDSPGGAFYSRAVTLGATGDFRVHAEAVVRQFEGQALGGDTVYPFGMFVGLANLYVGIAGDRFGAFSAGEGVTYYDIPQGFSVFDRHAYTLASRSGTVTFSSEGQTLFTAQLTGGSGAADLLQFGDGTGYANAAGRWFSLNFESGAIPEPTTWGLMLVGFGVMGCGIRRRGRPVARS